MSTKYKYQIKIDEGNKTGIVLTIVTQRDVLLNNIEISKLSAATETQHPEEIQLWLNMVKELKELLGALDGLPLDKIAGLSSDWAPLDEKYTNEFFTRLEALIESPLKLCVVGNPPDTRVDVSLGNTSAQLPLPVSQTVLAEKEIKALLDICEDNVREKKKHDDLVDAIRAAENVGKTTTAIAKCAAEIMKAETGPRAIPGILKACLAAVQSVRELQEAIEKQNREALDRAKREAERIHECRDAARSDGIKQAIDHAFTETGAMRA